MKPSKTQIRRLSDLSSRSKHACRDGVPVHHALPLNLKVLLWTLSKFSFVSLARETFSQDHHLGKKIENILELPPLPLWQIRSCLDSKSLLYKPCHRIIVVVVNSSQWMLQPKDTKPINHIREKAKYPVVEMDVEMWTFRLIKLYLAYHSPLFLLNNEQSKY